MFKKREKGVTRRERERVRERFISRSTETFLRVIRF